MNVALRLQNDVRDTPRPLTRLMSLLEGNRLGELIGRSAEHLGLNCLHVAEVKAKRLYPRSNSGFVLDVQCGNEMLFVEVVSGSLHDMAAQIAHRHQKQRHRLGADVQLRAHVDDAASCVVRVRGEDELIDGLPATLVQGRFGTDEVFSAKLLAHRLNRRAVVSVSQSDRSPAVIKAYKKGSQKADAAITLHAMLEKTAFGERSPVRVPKIIARCADWPGYKMEHVPGMAVTELTGNDRHDGMRLAGEALGRLHRLPLRLQSLHTSDDELTLLRSWILLVAQLFPQRTRSLHQAFATVIRLFESSAGEVQECIVHRDFHEGQILVAPDRATLIDFDTTCNGEAAQDIGNFLAHLDYAEALHGLDATADVEAFLSAYDKTHTANSAARIGAYRIATLLRLSCIHAISTESRSVAESLTERALSP